MWPPSWFFPVSNMSAHDDRFAQLEQLINKRFDTLEQFNKRFDTLEESNAQINNTLHSRQFVISEIFRENRDLRSHVRTLEERLLKLEKQVNNTEQNNRKNNIEVDGIPSFVTDEDLRGVVATLFNHITESDITIGDIEVAHRLYSKSSPKPTIVRLKRNIIEELKSKEARRKLKDIAAKMNFPRGTQIFLNDNQSPSMRSLSYNARLLKSNNIIFDTWFSNAAIRIKRTPTAKPIKITHEKDLVDAFPEFEHFTFDMNFYRRLQDEENINKYDDLEGYGLAEDEDETIFNSANSTSVALGTPSAAEIAAIINKISGFDPSSTSGSTMTNGGETGGVSEGASGGGASGADDEKVTDRGETVVETTPSPCPTKTPTAKESNPEDPPSTPMNPTGENGTKLRPLEKSIVNPHLTRSTTRNLGLFS